MLDRQPETDYETTLIIECWHDLGSCRPLGMSMVGAIPMTAFLAWATEHGLEWDARQRVWAVIQRLDSERAQRAANKARTNQGNPS